MKTSAATKIANAPQYSILVIFFSLFRGREPARLVSRLRERVHVAHLDEGRANFLPGKDILADGAKSRRRHSRVVPQGPKIAAGYCGIPFLDLTRRRFSKKLRFLKRNNLLRIDRHCDNRDEYCRQNQLLHDQSPETAQSLRGWVRIAFAIPRTAPIPSIHSGLVRQRGTTL